MILLVVETIVPIQSKISSIHKKEGYLKNTNWLLVLNFLGSHKLFWLLYPLGQSKIVRMKHINKVPDAPFFASLYCSSKLTLGNECSSSVI